MEKLQDMGLLCYGIRGLIYLEAFVKNNVIPSIVVVQGKAPTDLYKRWPDAFWKRYVDYYDIKKDLIYYISNYSIDIIPVDKIDVNSEELKNVLLKRPEKYFVFSGGGIIAKDMLNKDKEFIHIHPGMLPEYRGSTCYYYSMLKEKKCAATAFFMQNRLDTGNIISKKTFKIPCIDEKDWMFFDVIFDPWMRSELLKDIIGSYKRKKIFDSSPQDPSKGTTYFVIHPVLKNLVIKSKIK